jgi:hypothetical protein
MQKMKSAISTTFAYIALFVVVFAITCCVTGCSAYLKQADEPAVWTDPQGYTYYKTGYRLAPTPETLVKTSVAGMRQVISEIDQGVQVVYPDGTGFAIYPLGVIPE